MVIKSPDVHCPLCGGALSFCTFSRLFRCTVCDQHYGEDNAKYIDHGTYLIDAAKRYEMERKRK